MNLYDESYEDRYLRFSRGANEPMLDSIVDAETMLKQYEWLLAMYKQDKSWKDVIFRGPGIVRLLAGEDRDYMWFLEVVNVFHLYSDAMWRFTYYPLEMTDLDHTVVGVIRMFCENDLSSNNYQKQYIQPTNA